MVKWKMPVAFGTPEIINGALNPKGTEPVTVVVYGKSSWMVIVWLYGTKIVPCGSVAGENVIGGQHSTCSVYVVLPVQPEGRSVKVRKNVKTPQLAGAAD